MHSHQVWGTVLGSQLPAGSGQFKEADVQESTQLASSKISRLGSSSIDCRDKSLKGETLLGTSGSNSCSWPPDSHMHMHGDGLFTLPSADFVPWARGICISLFFLCYQCVQALFANLAWGGSTCRMHLHFVSCKWVALRVWLRRSPHHSGFESLKPATGIHPAEGGNERRWAKGSWEPHKEQETWFRNHLSATLEDQWRKIKKVHRRHFSSYSRCKSLYCVLWAVRMPIPMI